MSNEYDPGRSTDMYLTEVRTVLSRAETALADYFGKEEYRWYLAPAAPVYGDPEPYTYEYRVETRSAERRPFLGYTEGIWTEHPDAAKMEAALREAVRLLSPWRRTGRPKRA